MLSLLKGYFIIYIKQAGAPLYCDMVLSRQYWKRRQMRNIKIRYSPGESTMEEVYNKSAIPTSTGGGFPQYSYR